MRLNKKIGFQKAIFFQKKLNLHSILIKSKNETNNSARLRQYV